MCRRIRLLHIDHRSMFVGTSQTKGHDMDMDIHTARYKWTCLASSPHPTSDGSSKQAREAPGGTAAQHGLPPRHSTAAPPPRKLTGLSSGQAKGQSLAKALNAAGQHRHSQRRPRRRASATSARDATARHGERRRRSHWSSYLDHPSIWA